MNWDELYAFARYSLGFRALLSSTAVMTLLAGYFAYPRLSPFWRRVVWGLVVVLALGGASLLVGAVATNLKTPRDWDFLCFWTYGRVMQAGDSPYDQSLLRAAAAPHAPSASFQELNYCLYPPTSTVLFYPLGWFDLRAGMSGWYAVLLAAFAAAIYLLAGQLDTAAGPLRYWVATAAATLLFGSYYTFFYAQTTPLILLAVLLATSSPRASGWWYGCAAVVKPIAAIFCLPLLLRRDGRQAGLFFLPSLLAGGLFLALQGWDGVTAWRERNPLSDSINHSFFVEEMNQSLLAVTLRATAASPGASPLTFPPFVVLAGLLLGVTLVVGWRVAVWGGEGAEEYWLAVALLIYPGTLIHYNVLLLPPLFFVLRRATQLHGGWPIAVGLWGVVVGLSWLRLAFAANCVVWFYWTWQLMLQPALNARPRTPAATQPESLSPSSPDP